MGKSGGRRWVNRTVIGIGLASLFSDVGHEMATTAMPAFLLSMGASSAVLGLIEGLSDGLSSFAKLLSGLYSDRLRRRKPLAAAGYFVTAGGMASFALATQWWHVLLARLFGWVGRGVRTPIRKVLLAESTTPETYGRAFGLERAMDSAGAVVGPLLSVTLVGSIGLRRTFAFTLVPGIIAALLITFLVREKEHAPRPEARLWAGIASLPASFRRCLLGIGVAGIGDFSKTLLILWAAQAWTPHYGAARAAGMAMGFYAGYNVVYTVSCLVSGMLADRVSKSSLLAWGYAAAVPPAAMLLLPGDSLGKFTAVFGLSGLYMGVWETVESSMAASLLSPKERGTGFGVLSTVNGLGDLVSSAAVGLLWAVSPAAAMGFVIFTAVAGACTIAATGKPATASIPG